VYSSRYSGSVYRKVVKETTVFLIQLAELWFVSSGQDLKDSCSISANEKTGLPMEKISVSNNDQTGNRFKSPRYKLAELVTGILSL